MNKNCLNDVYQLVEHDVRVSLGKPANDKISDRSMIVVMLYNCNKDFIVVDKKEDCITKQDVANAIIEQKIKFKGDNYFFEDVGRFHKKNDLIYDTSFGSYLNKKYILYIYK